MNLKQIDQLFDYHIRLGVIAGNWLMQYRILHPTQNYIPDNDWNRILAKMEVLLKLTNRVLLNNISDSNDAAALLRLWPDVDECESVVAVGGLEPIKGMSMLNVKPSCDRFMEVCRTRSILTYAAVNDREHISSGGSITLDSQRPGSVLLVPCTYLYEPIGIIYFQADSENAFATANGYRGKLRLLSEIFGSILANDPAKVETRLHKVP